MAKDDEYDHLEPKNRFTAYNFTAACDSEICRDNSVSVNTKYYSLAAVCGGHRGKDYFRADRGSKMALDAFCSCAADTEFVKNLDTAEAEKMPSLIDKFTKQLIQSWKTAVEKDLKENPLTETELKSVYEKGEKTLSAVYSTALCGFVCGRRWCFGVQIGGGKCVAANNLGQMYLPTACLNKSASLSDENAAAEFSCRHEYFIGKDFPVAVFLCGEDMSVSFANDEKLMDFCRAILKKLSESRTDKPLRDLREQLPASFGILLYPALVNYEPKRWEGTGKRIFIDNFGDMDNDDDGPRYYSHTTLIPAKTGSYDVPIGRSGCYSVDILDVTDESVKFRYLGKEHLLTKKEVLTFTENEYQATYDGPWHNADDTTKFILL